MDYNPQEIEKKWQERWEKLGLYQATDFDKKPKQYILVEFPYPSGDGLHVGHARSYSALDTIARKRRMQGYDVLFPIGYDAFGLPTENYAIKTGIHPIEVTKKNTIIFREQLKSLGLSFDWSREINTTDPSYYKWTQWIFLQFFKKGLAYQQEMPINWCPSCKIGLANEEVVNGKCERCGAQTEKRNKKQWLLKITAYADRLIDDLKLVDFPERIKNQQINWIGKSEGTNIKFKIGNNDLEVFTTRIDTIFGVTALVLAPEHELVQTQKLNIKNWDEVEDYINKSKQKSEIERMDFAKEKTGVELKGVYAINPLNDEKIPIWIGDYVIATYGGGAVMVVPAHDERDYEFAKKYGIEIREVIRPGEKVPTLRQQSEVRDSDIRQERIVGAYIEYGKLVNSGEFNGLDSEKAIKKITKWLEKKKLGKKQINYHLRDWVFTRQHYWGEPIPIVHCEKCGVVPVNEKDLPVELPYVEKYEPTETGESPLSMINEWVNVKCPKCGGRAKRETDTMPNWAGSNWYFLRYCDPNNDKELADMKKLKYWMPVDLYNGGMEHVTLHLLYSRFVYKFLYDIGVVPEPEPYKRRCAHGMVLASDGQKMSKSRGNVINPDEIIKKYGADTVRLYEMFMGPYEDAIAWSTESLEGCARFLRKIWNIYDNTEKIDKETTKELIQKLHYTVKKVSDDIDNMKFNTVISSMMEFINTWNEKNNVLSRKDAEYFLKILAPLAPHITEELWETLGNKKSIFETEWPKYDEKLIKKDKIDLIVQINGKVRDKINVNVDISEKEAKELVLSSDKIKSWLNNQELKKIIFVKGKLINIVI
ncbi:MAG TPA: leucine--tRNA ligase [Candidatus Portnoybacteria bacterium]|nr:leucine--tRNA ligase [Candidatus Portnoybacteria bacterium]